MAYATAEDLIRLASTARLVELTDRADQPTGQIDMDRVTNALADASRQIDMRLASRYAVPITPAPAELRRIACLIALHSLYIDLAPEKLDEDVKAAWLLLNRIADGKAGLTDTAAADSDRMVLATGPERLFTRDRLKGF